MPTLDDINRLSPDGAKEFFLTCCGSSRWAEGMAACRPYWSVHVVFNAAEVIWDCLGAEDWREALRNRPESGAADAAGPLGDELELYRSKFGYGFVMAPPLPAGEELLRAVRVRLEHSPRSEFDTAAAQERACMRIVLRERLTP